MLYVCPKKENSIKRKTETENAQGQGGGKTANCKGEFRFACCMLHSAQHEIPYAHSEDAAAKHMRFTCGSEWYS